MAASIKKVTLVTEAVCCQEALEDVELKMVTMATQGEVVEASRLVDVVTRILVAAKELVARVVKVLPLVSILQAHNDGLIALMTFVQDNLYEPIIIHYFYPITGAVGGRSNQNHIDGGFGGGGGPNGAGGGGGGGGGYSGGASGSRSNSCGGGGGSFNIGSDQLNKPGANTGHGYVTVKALSFN